ncbi:hypothetical protein Ocepr_1930 [Oceanithermus profundus DSM 14977]|uniref:Uncharacterized protein n=1 Tax=Oceanithermus profundus (strain DSM 14977 / NBRC 100410 / VKM B-2274 / 506) TaxID=670487 RepID=E4UA05_OCEP5|nr:DsrE family protein [Oceanithermus profundus]ADR37382.1 hypothetical protein Ocepr_1930 [Oceanithermus profundus DSM 14977]
MAKILVLINSGPTEALKVRSGLTFARVAHDRGAEVRVIFFADGVRVPLTRDPDFGEALSALSERGIVPLVCRRILETTGGPLELPGFEVTYIGADLVGAVDEGFQVISF